MLKKRFKLNHAFVLYRRVATGKFKIIIQSSELKLYCNTPRTRLNDERLIEDVISAKPIPRIQSLRCYLLKTQLNTYNKLTQLKFNFNGSWSYGEI